MMFIIIKILSVWPHTQTCEHLFNSSSVSCLRFVTSRSELQYHNGALVHAYNAFDLDQRRRLQSDRRWRLLSFEGRGLKVLLHLPSIPQSEPQPLWSDPELT